MFAMAAQHAACLAGRSNKQHAEVNPDATFGSFVRLPGLPSENYPDFNDSTLRYSGAEKVTANCHQDVEPAVANDHVKPRHTHAPVDKIV